MEAKINIAEILKDKPQGTKLYDLLRNIDVELDKVHITDVGSYIVCTATNEAGITSSRRQRNTNMRLSTAATMCLCSSLRFYNSTLLVLRNNKKLAYGTQNRRNI